MDSNNRSRGSNFLPVLAVAALCFASSVVFGQSEFSINPGDFVPPTVISSGSRTTYDVSAKPGDVWHFEVLESSLAYQSVCAQVADESNNVLIAFTSNCGSGGVSKSFTATKQAVYKISIGPVRAVDMIAHLTFGCAGACPPGPSDVPRPATVTPRDLSAAKPGGGTVSVTEAFHLYDFYSTAGTQITLDLRRTGSSGNPCWRLYTPGGVFVQEQCSSLEAKASFLTTQAGNYLVYVIRTGISADMLYTITVGCNPSCPVAPPSTSTLQISTTTLPSAFIGAAYGPIQLTATGGTGTTTWSQTGLPALTGLTLSPFGVLTGTPTSGSQATYNMTVTATNGSATATAQLTLTIGGAPTPLQISTTSLPSGTAGTAYGPVQLMSTGGTGTTTWGVAGLPPGLAVSSAGVLSGTPAFAGIYTMTVSAINGGSTATAQLGLTIGAGSTSTLQISNTSLPSATVGMAYGPVQLMATGGTSATTTWNQIGLPAATGLTLSSAGVLSGTPATVSAATYTMTVTATNGGATATAQLALTIAAAPPPTLQISTTSLPVASVGTAYGPIQFTVTGGTLAATTWSQVGLPASTGLTLSSSGVLSGTPVSVSAGTYTMTVTATNGGATATAQLTLTIGAAALQISTLTLPPASVGIAYGPVQLAANGGTGGTTWSQTGLPASTGLTLSSTGGLGGTPASGSQGAYNMTVTASSGGAAATAQLTLTIAAAQAPTLQVSPGNLTFTGTAQAQTLTVTASMTLSFTVTTSGESWLRVDPASGITPGSVSVTASPNGLNPGTYSSTITISAPGAAGVPVPVKLTVAPPSTIRVTITSTPAGRAVLVDGTAITTPQDFDWTPGGSHTLDLTTPQGTGSVRYAYDHWSQGGAKAQSITAPSVATSFTAIFETQYLLTTSVAPSNGGSLSASPTSTDGFYNDSTQVQLTAAAANGFIFTGFGGDLTATASPQTVTMNSSKTITAGFTAVRPLSASPTQLTLNASQGSNATATIIIDGPAGQSVGVTSDQSWLGVNPSTSTPEFTVTVTAASSSLGAGSYQGNVIVGGTLKVPVTFSVSPPPVTPHLVTDTLAAGLQFQLLTGSAVPSAQTVHVTSSDGSTLNFTTNLAYPAGSKSWVNLSTRSGRTPGSVDVGVQVTALSQTGTYTATLMISTPGQDDIKIPLTLSYSQPPPSKLQVDVHQLTVSTTGDVQRRSVIVTNAGPSVLQFNATTQTTDGGSWLSVTPAGAATIDAQPAMLQISTDPKGLSPGVYTGTVAINTPNQDPLSITVIFAVGASKMLITADRALNFSVGRADTGFAPQPVELLASGNSPVSWQAQASASWLSLSPASGLAQPNKVSRADLSVDLSKLPVGNNMASITINSDSSGGALTIPVTFQVLPVGIATIRVTPTGMTFVGPSFSTTTAVFAPSKNGTVVVSSNQAWLVYKDTTSDISVIHPHSINVSIDPNHLPPGVAENRGTVTIQDPAGDSRTINVLAFVPAAATGGTGSPQASTAVCVPTRFLPLFTSLLPSFEQASGAATATEIVMIDDCGNPVASGVTGGVVSNRDPQLNLLPLGDGRWKATWNAVSAGAFVSLNVIGADPDRGINPSPPAQSLSSIVGTPTVPVLAKVQPFETEAGVALPAIAPNLQFRINGQNLVNADSSPPVVTLGGTSLTVVSASDSQLLVLTPANLPTNVEMQLVITRNDGSANIPEPVIAAAMWPGLAVPTSGGNVLWVTGLGTTPEKLTVEGAGIRKIEARGSGLWRVVLDRPAPMRLRFGPPTQPRL